MYTKWSFILLQNCVRLTCVHCTCTLYTKLIFWLQYQTSSQALIKMLWRFLSFTVGAFSFSVAMLTVIDLADFSAIIKPAPSPAKTDYFSYYFRRWCCFTWCSKEGKSNKGMYTILLFSIWFSVVTSANLAWENSRHLSALLLVSPPNDVWETSAEIPYWWRVIRSG